LREDYRERRRRFALRCGVVNPDFRKSRLAVRIRSLLLNLERLPVALRHTQS
jgi:hypothetical protein